MKIAENVYQISGLIYGRNSSVFAIDTAEGIVLIDSGFSEDQYLAMKKVMNKWDLSPDRINTVFLTHAHFDHAGNAWRLHEDGATIYAGTPDARAIRNGGNVLLEDLFGAAFHTFDEVQNLEGGEQFSFGDTLIEAISMPGHTEGTFAYLAEVNGVTILFVGDMFMIETASPQDELVVKLGWDGSPDYNAKDNYTSMEKLTNYSADILAPGHAGIYCGPCENIFNQLCTLAQKEV